MDYNLMDALEMLEREKGVPRDTILEEPQRKPGSPSTPIPAR